MNRLVSLTEMTRWTHSLSETNVQPCKINLSMKPFLLLLTPRLVAKFIVFLLLQVPLTTQLLTCQQHRRLLPVSPTFHTCTSTPVMPCRTSTSITFKLHCICMACQWYTKAKLAFMTSSLPCVRSSGEDITYLVWRLGLNAMLMPAVIPGTAANKEKKALKESASDM